MDTQSQITEARARFARSLVGRWSTASGTFGTVMDQTWEIRPDGTGCFTDTGPFGHPRSETRFEWRQSEPFVFELRVTEIVAHHPDDAVEAEDWDWEAIRYDFVPVRTDVGVLVGLIDVAQIGTEFGGFLHSLAPLSYGGAVR